MDIVLLGKVAKACETELGLATVEKFLSTKSDDLGNAILAHIGHYKAVILSYPEKERLLRFYDLVNYLGTSYSSAIDTPAKRGDWLVAFNQLFDIQWVHIGKSGRKKDLPAEWIAIMAEIDACHTDQSTALLKFIAAHKQSAHEVLYDIREAWHAKGFAKGDVYIVIEALHRNLVRLDALSSNTCVDLKYLIADHQPNQKFKGFQGWGTGDAADKSVDTNIDGHFFKHVLNAGSKDLDWLEECRVWWKLLNIELPKAEIAKVSAGHADTLCGSEANLPMAKILPFLQLMHDSLKDKASSLRAWFRTHHLAGYRDAALDFAAKLTKPAVYFERGAVYVSGCHGDYYVVGRIDGALLKISACYVAQDINDKMKRDILWLFSA